MRATKRTYINVGLLAIIIGCNSYLLLGFLSPAITPVIKQTFNPVSIVSAAEAATTPNKLLIPKIQVDTPIKTDDTAASLDNAAWLRPESVDPGQSGNVVLAGHRFSYIVDPIFYNLDRLVQGDEIQIIWEGRPFTYRVTEQRIVEPTATEIEEQSGKDKLTIYTCTPLWSTEKRLVIIAEPVNE